MLHIFWKNLWQEYLEYVLVLLIVIECNSLFNNSIDNGSMSVGVYLFRTAILLTWILCIYYVLTDERVKKQLKSYLLLILALLGFVAFFGFVNVRALHNDMLMKDYVRSFVFFLPGIIFLNEIKRTQEKPFELFYKYSNIVTGLALFSIMVYLAFTISPNTVMADLLRTRWSGVGHIRELCNYLNVCNVDMSDFRDIAGVRIYRNIGWYPESPMFSLALVTALYTELFLKKRWPVIWRCVVLILAILSSQATLGMILMTFGLGIKVLEISGERWKKAVLPVLLLVSFACLFFVWQKISVTGSSSLSSMAVHIDDYKVAFKAFLQKPIIGWGYNEEQYIRQYMSEERLISNSGLSNSIAVILAEGGVALGSFCMLPYGVCASSFMHKKREYLAYWTVGVFGLYCLVIFHFRLFFLLILGFGYSLVDIKLNDGKVKIQVAVPEREEDAQECNEVNAINWNIVVLVFAMGVTALLCFCRPLWTVLTAFLKRNQILLGSSVWKSMLFICVLMYAFWLIQCVVGVKCEDDRKASFYIFLRWIVVSIFYAFVYPMIYSLVVSVLEISDKGGDLKESFILFAAYCCFIALVEIVAAAGRHFEKGKIAIWIGSIGVSVLTCAIGYDIAVKKCVDIFKVDAQEIKVVNELMSSTNGTLYSDTIPVVYKQYCPTMRLSATKGKGHSLEKDISIIVDHSIDNRELYDNGFYSVEISPSHILYTNDSSVLDTVLSRGEAYQSYYPYPMEIDMDKMAANNGLERKSSGGVVLKGKEQSVYHGPWTSIEKGTYTLRYHLHRSGIERPDEKIGFIRIAADSGRDILKIRDIYSSDFDEKGFYTAEVQFEASQRDGVEYLLIAEEGQELEIFSGDVRQTPEYVVRRKYNGRRQVVLEQYYTLQNAPYRDKHGFYAKSFGYDHAGNTSVIKYLNNVLEPCMTDYGYAEIHRDYNSRGWVIKESYYGENGELLNLPSGYAMKELEYDQDGNAVDLKFFDTKGKPVLTSMNYAEIRRDFDEKRRVIREAYFDINGNPADMPQGYAMTERAYDEKGNVIIECFCDGYGTPVMTNWNYAEVHRNYNEKNQVVQESYFDNYGSMINVPQGYAVNEREYDVDGNVCVQRYCDASGKPVMTTWNYAEVHRVFDDKRRIIEESYYDTEGDLIALPSGQAEVHREYNDANQVIREVYFGLDGKPVNMPQGYAVNEREYDADGNACVQRYCDVSGKPVMTTWNYAEVHRVFDDKRRIIEESYYDTEGNLLALPSGQAEVHREYNDADQVIREAYFGLDGKPVNMPQGYAVNERAYDENGNACVHRYCDASGKPVMTTWNYAEVHRVFDDKRRIIEESYYDTEGGGLVLPSGQAEVHREYNDANQIVRESYFGLDGKPMNMPQGYAINEREYDAAGNAVIQRFCDTAGIPVMTTWGYAEVHREFDEKRRIICEKYYDTMGKQIQLPSGKGIEERDYDEAGRLVEQRFSDLEGSPVMLTGGYASLRREYDENGQQIRIIYYDLEGREVEPKA